MFEPKHKARDVAFFLAEGLRNGTIVLPSEDEDYRAAPERRSSYGESLRNILDIAFYVLIIVFCGIALVVELEPYLKSLSGWILPISMLAGTAVGYLIRLVTERDEMRRRMNEKVEEKVDEKLRAFWEGIHKDEMGGQERHAHRL